MPARIDSPSTPTVPLSQYLDTVLTNASDEERASAKVVATELLRDTAATPLDASVRERVRDELSSLNTGGLPEIVSAMSRALAPEAETVTRHPAVAGALSASSALREHLDGRVADVLARSVVHLAEQFRADEGSRPHDPPLLFSEWLAGPGFEVLWTDYGPALAHAAHVLGASVAAMLEMLDRLSADRDDLERVFGIDRTDEIARMHLGAGDTHHGGRVVSIVTFVSGARVVYKPRSLASDRAFARIIEWMRDAVRAPLAYPDTLDRGAYGYASFIESVTECTPQEAHDHLTQLGHVLAVLRVLGASDIHFENLVMSGRGPIVVDTETLMTGTGRAAQTYADGAASTVASLAMANSVLGIGVLPTLIGDGNQADPLDIGVLGFRAGQASPFRSVVIEDAATPAMRTALAHTTVMGVEPAAPFARVPAATQRDLIRFGFTSAVRAIAERRDEFASELKQAFTGVTLRHVLAPSAGYRQLLTLSHHPDALRNPAMRAAVLSRIVLRTGRPRDDQTSLSEARQLAHGDIPHFTVLSDQCPLRVGAPDRMVGAPLEVSPLQRALNALDTLVSDEGRDLRYIDLAFVNALDTADDVTAVTRHSIDGADPSRVESVARRLLDELAERQITGVDSQFPATWIDPSVTVPDQAQWAPGTLGYDLYGGAPGIALALAAGARVFGSDEHRRAALAVLAPLARQFSEGAIDELPYAVGGMTGAGSTAYALAAASSLLDGDLKLDRAALLRVIARGIDDPAQSVDFIGGVSGALAAALAVDDGTQSDHIEEIARRSAERIALAISANDYTGFAHGRAGMGVSVLRAGAHLGDDRLVVLGGDLIRGVVNQRRGRSWPRTFTPGDRDAADAWCHGTTGILLAAAEAEQWGVDVGGRGLLEDLVNNVLDHGLGNNPTLCHGDAGVLDVLAQVALWHPMIHVNGCSLEDVLLPVATANAQTTVELIAARRNRYGFVSSLMVGQSGTVWSLLRALRPDLVPSVLGLLSHPSR